LRGALLALVMSIPVACDLNPQPEVPSSDVGGTGAMSGGGVGGGGAVGPNDGGGLGGISAGGAGGTTSVGGAAGGPGLDAGLASCASPCKGGELCYQGSCVDDPCEPNSCSANQACKPNASFDASACFDSCAGVSCPTGQACSNGKCEPTGCGTDCSVSEVCAPSADGGFECVPDACDSDAAPQCGTGTACDPVTGACVIDPCAGVKCPVGQECVAGECEAADDAGTPDAGSDAGATDAGSD